MVHRSGTGSGIFAMLVMASVEFGPLTSGCRAPKEFYVHCVRVIQGTTEAGGGKILQNNKNFLFYKVHVPTMAVTKFQMSFGAPISR